jgi:GDPmannose 4,6-dehydratase
VDWGYAPDYVDAMVRMLELDRPEDLVVASGTAHRVEDFARIAFEVVGLDWRKHVRSDASILAKPQKCRIGNSARLRSLTGWAPSVSFQEMVGILVRAEQQRTNAGEAGAGDRE